jgi:hypothetical protein
MKSFIDMKADDIDALTGAVHCFRDAILENPKIVPTGRAWKDNERKARAEHLDYIHTVLDGIKSGKNSVSIDGFFISFDLAENDMMAIYCCCDFAVHSLENNQDFKEIVLSKPGLLEHLKTILNNMKIIKLNEESMTYDYE